MLLHYCIDHILFRCGFDIMIPGTQTNIMCFVCLRRIRDVLKYKNISLNLYYLVCSLCFFFRSGDCPSNYSAATEPRASYGRIRLGPRMDAYDCATGCVLVLKYVWI